MRVVMLVDNAVDGDSRVQKSARFMAHKGWDVTLIGVSAQRGRRYALGAAKVRILKAPGKNATLGRNPQPRGWRQPFAYPSLAARQRRELELRWGALDLQSRAATGQGGIRDAAAQWRHGWAQRWHRTRSEQTEVGALRWWTQPQLPLHGRRQWRWDNPVLADFEMLMADAIVELKPHLIHAHDFQTIPIAVRAADRIAAETGKRPAVVYDAHEYLPGVAKDNERRKRGYVRAEAEHIGRADAVVTVADGIADILREEHRLARRPMVVANAPMRWDGHLTNGQIDVRRDFGLAPDTPVLVYLGGVAAKRRVDTIIEAMAELPGARLVLLTKPNIYLDELLAAAEHSGYRHRILVRGYVDPDDVAAYVSTATATVLPYPGEGDINHELAMPNKLFESIQGGTPLLVSDMKTAAAFVEEHRIGLVFRAGDTDDYVSAARRMFADHAQFRSSIQGSDLPEVWCWQRQCEPVDALYRELTGRAPELAVSNPIRAALATGSPVTPAAVQAAAVELLDLADGMPKRPRLAAANMRTAGELLLHRQLHFTRSRSPLADDPAGYLANWRASATVARLAGGGARRAAPEVPRDARALVLTAGNRNFADSLVNPLAQLCGSVDELDLDADIAIKGMPSGGPQTCDAAYLARGREPKWAGALRDRLAAYDLVVVDWAMRAAILATIPEALPGRVVVRLHSAEAFSVYPHYVDWSKVDDVVFVGPQLRELATEAVPGIADANTHVIGLGVESAAFRLPKWEGADHTLVVVGWNSPAKDAGWAIDVIDHLHKYDERYRLLLVGSEPGEKWAAYRDAILPRVAASRGAVEIVPQTRDVPAVLRRAGFVLSSSVRESYHSGLVEGAASAAVPVVRDWPLLHRQGGARPLYPADWIVNSPEEAAERIIAHSLPEARRRVGDDAARWVNDRLSAERIAAAWSSLLWGEAAVASSSR